MPLYERAFVLKIGTTYFPYQKKRELSHTLVSAFSLSYIYISCLALSLSLSPLLWFCKKKPGEEFCLSYQENDDRVSIGKRTCTTDKILVCSV